MLRNIFAIGFSFLLGAFLVGLVCGQDHNGFALKASEQTHLSPLGSGRNICLARRNTGEPTLYIISKSLNKPPPIHVETN